MSSPCAARRRRPARGSTSSSTGRPLPASRERGRSRHRRTGRPPAPGQRSRSRRSPALRARAAVNGDGHVELHDLDAPPPRLVHAVHRWRRSPRRSRAAALRQRVEAPEKPDAFVAPDGHHTHVERLASGARSCRDPGSARDTPFPSLAGSRGRRNVLGHETHHLRARGVLALGVQVPAVLRVARAQARIAAPSLVGTDRRTSPSGPMASRVRDRGSDRTGRPP